MGTQSRIAAYSQENATGTAIQGAWLTPSVLQVPCLLTFLLMAAVWLCLGLLQGDWFLLPQRQRWLQTAVMNHSSIVAHRHCASQRWLRLC